VLLQSASESLTPMSPTRLEPTRLFWTAAALGGRAMVCLLCARQPDRIIVYTHPHASLLLLEMPLLVAPVLPTCCILSTPR
jgi:hypothetical protein